MTDDVQRESVVQDCVKLIEDHISSRGAIRRVTLGAGLAMLKAVKPNALERAAAMLLPDFAEALNPLYQRFRQTGQRDFRQFLLSHGDEATQSLIQASDQRAARIGNAAIKKAYGSLRGSAEAEVRAALPALATLLGRRLPTA